MDPLAIAANNISIMFSVFVIIWVFKQCILVALWIGKKVTEYDRYISTIEKTDSSEHVDDAK